MTVISIILAQGLTHADTLTAILMATMMAITPDHPLPAEWIMMTLMDQDTSGISASHYIMARLISGTLIDMAMQDILHQIGTPHRMPGILTDFRKFYI